MVFPLFKMLCDLDKIIIATLGLIGNVKLRVFCVTISDR